MTRSVSLGAYMAAASIVFLAVLGMAEIVLRSFFAYSIQFALEYGTYLLAVAMLAGSGWTLRSGGHIRISLLSSALPTSGARTLDLLTSVLALAVSTYFCRAAIGFTIQSFETGMLSSFPSQTPLGYPQLAFAASVVFLTLGLAARCIRLVVNEAPETAPTLLDEHTLL